MKIPDLFRGNVFSLFLLLAVSPSNSLADKENDSSLLMEKWGQLMLCQRIYQMPEVRTRLYDFDLDRCNGAEQAIIRWASRYNTQEQSAIRLQAERHARSLSYNTSEPYHSVPACREYCTELAEAHDER